MKKTKLCIIFIFFSWSAWLKTCIFFACKMVYRPAFIFLFIYLFHLPLQLMQSEQDCSVSPLWIFVLWQREDLTLYDLKRINIQNSQESYKRLVLVLEDDLTITVDNKLPFLPYGEVRQNDKTLRKMLELVKYFNHCNIDFILFEM